MANIGFDSGITFVDHNLRAQQQAHYSHQRLFEQALSQQNMGLAKELHQVLVPDEPKKDYTKARLKRDIFTSRGSYTGVVEVRPRLEDPTGDTFWVRPYNVPEYEWGWVPEHYLDFCFPKIEVKQVAVRKHDKYDIVKDEPFVVGEKVETTTDSANNCPYAKGKVGTIYKVEDTWISVQFDKDLRWAFTRNNVKPYKETTKVKEIVTDIKEYIKEHKAIIYTVLLIVVLDHIFLGGKLRSKLEEMLGSALDSIKGKLDSGNKN